MLQPGASVYWKRYLQKNSFPPHWRGPYQVLLINTCATKLQRTDTWVHAAHLNRSTEHCQSRTASEDLKAEIPRTEAGIWWGRLPKMCGPCLLEVHLQTSDEDMMLQMTSRAYDLDDRQTLIKSVWEFSLPPAVFVTQLWPQYISSLCNFPSDLGPDTLKGAFW